MPPDVALSAVVSIVVLISSQPAANSGKPRRASMSGWTTRRKRCMLPAERVKWCWTHLAIFKRCSSLFTAAITLLGLIFSSIPFKNFQTWRRLVSVAPVIAAGLNKMTPHFPARAISHLAYDAPNKLVCSKISTLFLVPKKIAQNFIFSCDVITARLFHLKNVFSEK